MQKFEKLYAKYFSASGSDICNSSVHITPLNEEEIPQIKFGYIGSDEWGRFHKNNLVSIEIDTEWLARIANYFKRKVELSNSKYDILYEGVEEKEKEIEVITLKIIYDKLDNLYTVQYDCGNGLSDPERLGGCIMRNIINKKKTFTKGDSIKVRYNFNTKQCYLVWFEGGMVNWENEE